MLTLKSYAEGSWHTAKSGFADIHSAVTDEVIAKASSKGLDFASMVRYGRKAGVALRALTFHQRADMLKKLALHLTNVKAEFYTSSLNTGALKNDGAIDIEGGIGTLFVYATKGKKELPAETFIIDGETEVLGKTGQFAGRHILTPLQGVAFHINAFNFPVWGMLEKFAPAFLAGMPVITKPATVTAYLTELVVQRIIESGILPEGSLQLIVGSTGDMMDHLGSQDVIAFTGSASTSEMLQRHPNIARHSIRFTAERDSLNAAILAPDATPETPEFDLFIKEISREMTVKAGQKCTAIRRIIAPHTQVEAVIDALKAKLSAVKIGSPYDETSRMGALVGLSQRTDVLNKITSLSFEAEVVYGSMEQFQGQKGAFISPHLLYCKDGMAAEKIHAEEAFGPVSTVMGYSDIDEAIALVKKGDGSLVASAYTYDLTTAAHFISGFASYHGRLLFQDRDCAKESTGHGSPMPHLIHGGPGRAGGGEELGGVRSVYHHCQKTAIQGSPRLLSGVTKSWMKGASIIEGAHPFTMTHGDLALGQTFNSASRTITQDDIAHFATFTGDNFYAHTDAKAVEGHPFFPGLVAHGYLLLSFAAGLFVEAKRGPVLANYGLENLRFVKPVQAGETIKVRLTVMEKAPSKKEYGEVRWDVEITNIAGETVASYHLLTMNSY
jgi:oxepin-CoA hydrolase / 3-oxo-5,6-dehydrosuberyl-CoA semialdehyde dehydrogenase